MRFREPIFEQPMQVMEDDHICQDIDDYSYYAGMQLEDAKRELVEHMVIRLSRSDGCMWYRYILFGSILISRLRSPHFDTVLRKSFRIFTKRASRKGLVFFRCAN